MPLGKVSEKTWRNVRSGVNFCHKRQTVATLSKKNSTVEKRSLEFAKIRTSEQPLSFLLISYGWLSISVVIHNTE